MVNKRILKIIDVLLQHDHYVTIDVVSIAMQVSNKTIRNDLSLIEELLKENSLTLIKKTGVGIYIEGTKEDKLHIMGIIHEKNKTNIDYSPQARKNFIGMQLISTSDNCRIYELSSQLYVSRATIHKDILSLTKAMEPFHIQLHRKNNNGISIEGKERNLRDFLLELMLNDNGYQMFVDILKDEHYECDGSLVFPGLEVSDDEVKDFIQCILATNNRYINTLSFPSLILVMLHLFLTYLRIQEAHFVDLSSTFIAELEKEPFYKETKELVEALTTRYKITCPEIEIRYLQVHFISLQTSEELQDDIKEEAEMLCNALIQDWTLQLQLPFDQDQDLKLALFAHLCPAITRFRHAIAIENSLMDEIYSLYKNTFVIAKKSVHCIEEYFHCKVNDDEIGFLTLHLATALDRLKQPLKTIVVCHGGIGASNLLVRKLSIQIPEINIISYESFFSIFERDLYGIDLIISTMQLRLQHDIPLIQINSILHDYDILRLKDIAKEYYKIKNNPLNQKAEL